MRFRKYSRKHAFNILFQWDVTGEELSKIASEYWENLERAYGSAIKVFEDFLKALEEKSVDPELFARKFEAIAEEEVIADKLRRLAYAAFILLKQLSEFHDFTIAMTEWLSERNRKRKLKAYQILNEIKRTLNSLAEGDPQRREDLERLVAFLERVENAEISSFEELKRLEEEFRAEVLKVVKKIVLEALDFAKKRLSEDMGEIKEYANLLVEAYKNNKLEIDSTIEEFLKDWTLDSLGSVERNLLRLGAAEFLFVGVQDPGRAFNDYIDFAKAFVGKKAARFVNGVLSSIYNKRVKADQNAEGGQAPPSD